MRSVQSLCPVAATPLSLAAASHSAASADPGRGSVCQVYATNDDTEEKLPAFVSRVRRNLRDESGAAESSAAAAAPTKPTERRRMADLSANMVPPPSGVVTGRAFSICLVVSPSYMTYAAYVISGAANDAAAALALITTTVTLPSPHLAEHTPNTQPSGNMASDRAVHLPPPSSQMARAGGIWRRSVGISFEICEDQALLLKTADDPDKPNTVVDGNPDGGKHTHNSR